MFEYVASPTGMKFHESDAPIKMIMGPFGSGKSTCCAYDLLLTALAQPPGPDKVRYSRFGVLRASYPNLAQTTRRSILEVMPPGSGTITTGNAPLRGLFTFRLPDRDGTSVQAEFELWSSLTGEDAEKFKSSNWTAVWFNEATEVDFEVLTLASTRTNRYPPRHLGGCRWGGIIMDFNRPPHGHWLEGLFGREEMVLELGGETRRYPVLSLTQPPAAFKKEDDVGAVTYDVNPDAENLTNLRGGTDFYAQQIALWLQNGRTDEIDRLYCLLDAVPKAGRPVWPMFSERRHVASSRVEPTPGAPLLIGCDTSGIHPAAVFMQFRDNRWCVTDELYGDREGLDVFMKSGLMHLSRMHYPGSRVTVSCDPANARDSFTGLSPTAHLARAGFEVTVPFTNRPATRVSAVAQMLNVDIGGLLISPHCKILIEAMQGGDGPRGYHYQRHRLRGSVDAVYSDAPEKNDASHMADALQYAALHVNRDRPADERSVRAAGYVARRNRGKRRLLG
jgi:hypothetical protein